MSTHGQKDINSRKLNQYSICVNYSPIVPGVYVLLLTDCTGSLCFVTHRLYLEFVLLLTDCTWSLFCYSQIVPGVYALLLTDCSWIDVLLLTDCTCSLCFVTHRLYLEFMLYYSQIVPAVYVLLLTDCTWSLCFVTHRL